MVAPFAFVLMPFGPDFTDVYKLGIQSLAKELGVVAERVDEQTYSESILERIYRQIEVADFIIADMTGRNPNVFYEVGCAHAKGKTCTLLTQSSDDIPFDLKHHRHLVYGGSIQKLRSLLVPELEWLVSETEKRRSSTIAVSVARLDGLLTKTDYMANAELTMVFDVNNRTERRSPELEAMYIHTGSGWTFTQDGVRCPSTESDDPEYSERHFVRLPMSRLSSGAWAQVRLDGKKMVWSKYRGDELETRKNWVTVRGGAMMPV